ncbi:MAG: DNA repair protein RadA, partial [Clostridiales bacterium]|nr:DNA repair protein RadA [Clostridiales bacterium]
MAKKKIMFVCQNCGNTSPKWLGKCPECGEWDTFIEEYDEGHKNISAGIINIKKLDEIDLSYENRL